MNFIDAWYAFRETAKAERDLSVLLHGDVQLLRLARAEARRRAVTTDLTLPEALRSVHRDIAEGGMFP